MRNTILLFTFLFLISFACKAWNTNGAPPFVVIEQMPTYPGGEEALYKHIKENTFYPLSALKDSIQGRVTVRFLVDTLGCVKDIKVLRGIHPDCDSMAKSVVRLMLKWIPARSAKGPTEMRYTLPITFKIPEDKDRIISYDCAMPTFPGGEKAMFEFIHKNLKDPVTHDCFQGRVIVRFVVNHQGKVSNAFVLRGIDSQVETEALKVVNMMPDWIPAQKDGKNYNYLFTLPIVFRLQ